MPNSVKIEALAEAPTFSTNQSTTVLPREALVVCAVTARTTRVS